MLGEHAHTALATLFDAPGGYAGYKPSEKEAPNSDGRVDAAKRYLHVALKYNPPDWARDFLAVAHFAACEIAERIGVPDAFMPRVENGTLRVLEYPAGSGTVEHTDFDLFTVNLWRSTPEDHERHEPDGPYYDARWVPGRGQGWHTGRIGELVGLGPATPHRVPARDYSQRALVYFAMPAMAARFPNEVRVADAAGEMRTVRTVKEWLDVVYAQSRVQVAGALGGYR